MLNWEKNKHEFGNWSDEIKPFFELLQPVYERLKADTRRGKKILPAPENVFRVFKEVDFTKLKAVVCGIGPYHTITKDKQIIADGIALSCGNTRVEQPSLTKFYDALEKEFPENACDREPDLSYLCHDGILMFNTSLTVENNKALSHNDLWRPFVKEFFSKVIGPTGVPVITLGSEAKWIEKTLAPFQWYFPLTHPASASYAHMDWDSEGVFKKVQTIIQERGHVFEWIDDLPF